MTQLNAYMEALERINANIAFKGSQSDSRSTARLVEAGTRKLTQLYTTLVAEASSGDPPYMFPLQPGLRVDPSALVPFPRPIATEISTLVSFLRTLPLPATHPSHPAAAQVLSALLEAQRGCADMRGSWAKRCLESGVRLATEGESGRADESVRAGLEFAQWVVTLLDVVEVNATCPIKVCHSQVSPERIYVSRRDGSRYIPIAIANVVLIFIDAPLRASHQCTLAIDDAGQAGPSPTHLFGSCNLFSFDGIRNSKAVGGGSKA